MATKNLYQAHIVLHDDEDTDTPFLSRTVFVMGKNPSQVNSKIIQFYGDALMFIQQIEYIATNDPLISECGGGVNPFVG